MRSEALDITIESRGSSVLLVLAGPFHNEQIPNIREKITGLIDDGAKEIVVDLEGVTEMNDGVVPMFLGLYNLMKGKRGDLKLIFRNAVVSTAFAPYRNIFSIHPDARSLAFNSIMHRIRRRGLLMSRKTGVRLSPPVAMFIFLVLLGWFLTLGFIISMQNARIRGQEQEINELSGWKEQAVAEIQHLKDRLRPIEQLGLIRDSTVAAVITNINAGRQVKEVVKSRPNIEPATITSLEHELQQELKPRDAAAAPGAEDSAHGLESMP